MTIEINTALLAEERLFRNLLGFHRNFGIVKKREPDWMMSQAGRAAIHLHHATEPCVPEYGHVCVLAPDFDRTIRQLCAFGYPVEAATLHWGYKRAYTVCPTGHNVEVLEKAPPNNCGMPKESEL